MLPRESVGKYQHKCQRQNSLRGTGMRSGFKEIIAVQPYCDLLRFMYI